MALELALTGTYKCLIILVHTVFSIDDILSRSRVSH